MSAVHVFLDVDGVLNAVAVNPPRWEPTRELYERVQVNGFAITYARALIEWLNEASRRPGVVFHWLTTWEHDAPLLLCPAIGLDGADWPVLGTGDRYVKELSGGWWKHRAVIDHMAANPEVSAVWIDDDITFDRAARLWLSEHPEVQWVSPATYAGITPKQRHAIDGWLRAEAAE